MHSARDSACPHRCINVISRCYIDTADRGSITPAAVKDNRTLTPRQEARAERALFAAILTLRSIEECRAFFRDLCTPAELQALADRWSVVGLLQEGVPYREIHKQTGVSVTTIGRVARFLSTGNGGYQLAAERLKTDCIRSEADLPARSRSGGPSTRHLSGNGQTGEVRNEPPVTGQLRPHRP